MKESNNFENDTLYEGIKNQDLRKHIINADELFETNIDNGTILIKKLWEWRFRSFLGLGHKDAQWMTGQITKRGIMDSIEARPIYSKAPTHNYDKDRWLGLVALSWFATKGMPFNENGSYNLIRANVDWNNVVSETRAAFGEHPLVNLIHDVAVENKEEQNIVIAVKEKEVVKQEVQETSEKIAKQEKSTNEAIQEDGEKGIKAKFPVLEDDEIDTLRMLNLRNMVGIIPQIPEHQIEVASLIKHGVPDYLLRVLMFVSYIDKKKLNLYRPNEDTYSLIEFREAVIIAKNYLLVEKMMAEKVIKENLKKGEDEQKRYIPANNLMELFEKMQRYLIAQERKSRK